MMMPYQYVIFSMLGLFVIVLIVIFLMQRSHRKERMELVKMVASKSYGEYESYNTPRKDSKPPPREHNGMISGQQKKMRHEKGGNE